MTKIYLVRHGETLFNVMELNQGQCDSPLTENGKNQAKLAKKYLDQFHFDAVYTSTSERAIDTTEIITSLPYTKLKTLKEIFLGTKEATTCENNPTYPYGDYFVKYGGEDLDEFTNRIHNAIESIAKNHNNQTVLIVSHGTAIRRFLTLIENKNYEVLSNCAIVELEYDNGFKLNQIVEH